MKTDPVAGDEIEFSCNVRQRCLRTDAANHAANTEELCRPAEERFLISIEAESFVPEELAEIEKITGAAAKIENVQRWRTVQPKVLHTLDVYVDPVSGIFIGIDLPCIGPVRITLAQPL